MAGVRSNNNYDNNEFPISLPKGIPGNISIVTKIDYERWGCDAHSASWFNEEEIDRLKEWLKRYYPSLSFEQDILHYTYLFGSGLTDFKHYNDCIVEGVDSIRLIFWFDN
jgi:alanine dehydrogenase